VNLRRRPKRVEVVESIHAQLYPYILYYAPEAKNHLFLVRRGTKDPSPFGNDDDCRDD
jgi:hypothetical protein